MSDFEEQTGKIGSRLFHEILLPRCGKNRDEIRTGPKFGVDTSVVDLGGGLGLAVSSDPLSLIPSLGLRESAWLSVHLLVNDMATTGFSPMYAQFVLNLPTSLTRRQFETYWDEIHRFCEETGVAITGGHTGQIEGQNSTVSGGGTMFLTAPVDQIVTTDGASAGDRLIVTKESALVSTSILAKSFPETVKGHLGEELYNQACENFWSTSSLREAMIASRLLENRIELTAMHDVTEGGVLGAIDEMASASGCGFRVDADAIPVGEAPQRVADLFAIDPRISVGAGSMLLAVRPGSETELIRQLEQEGIPAADVGSLTGVAEGRTIVESDEEKLFEYDGTDPYWAAFFGAIEKGWN